MRQQHNRTYNYNSISAELSKLNDARLLEIIEEGNQFNSHTGGASKLTKINGVNVFVKKVPLTDLEMQPTNNLSTSNLFNVPLFCQYGLANESPGFNAWRELSACRMTSNWVEKNECNNFPLLFHWRILHTPEKTIVDNEQLNRKVSFWENNNSVRKRFEALDRASSSLVMFMEYVPQTLMTWFHTQSKDNPDRAVNAIRFIEKNINSTVSFMKKQHLVHFDLHFDNILTDGNLIYLSDFGLALSSQFDLSKEEHNFFTLHKNYDYCRWPVDLLYCIFTLYFKDIDWIVVLKKYPEMENTPLSPEIDSIVKKYLPIVLAQVKFIEALRKNKMKEEYPAEQMAKLLKEINVI